MPENTGMKDFARLASITLLPVVCLVTMPGHRCLGQTKRIPTGTKPSVTAAEEVAAERKRQDRREFQLQELMLAKAGGWIFKPGETPRVLWRDSEAVSRLGCVRPLPRALVRREAQRDAGTQCFRPLACVDRGHRAQRHTVTSLAVSIRFAQGVTPIVRSGPNRYVSQVPRPHRSRPF